MVVFCESLIESFSLLSEDSREDAGDAALAGEDGYVL